MLATRNLYDSYACKRAEQLGFKIMSALHFNHLAVLEQTECHVVVARDHLDLFLKGHLFENCQFPCVRIFTELPVELRPGDEGFSIGAEQDRMVRARTYLSCRYVLKPDRVGRH